MSSRAVAPIPREALSFARWLALAREAGAKPFQERLLVRAWLAGRPLASASRSRAAPFARRLLDALPALERELADVARVLSSQGSSDGSQRWLVELAGRATVETVLLPNAGLCLSTQVGCAVGCVFCKTGELGLARNLTALELCAQLAIARAARPVRRIVLMGMGEPSHNLAAVIEALEWIGLEGALAHKHVVFSTVGDPRCFERLLAARVRPALALSLHSTFDDKRADLLPRAPKIAVERLVAHACDYADAVTWPLLVQWTLIDRINDGDDELARLGDLLRGRRAMVNVIGYNAIEGGEHRRAPRERAIAWVRALRARGVIATIRDSAGQDVDAGCGQLRSRAAPSSA